jgi:hypothetical protein
MLLSVTKEFIFVVLVVYLQIFLVVATPGLSSPAFAPPQPVSVEPHHGAGYREQYECEGVTDYECAPHESE